MQFSPATERGFVCLAVLWPQAAIQVIWIEIHACVVSTGSLAT
jgi:hypothetical protein